MSKYNLTNIAEGMGYKEFEDAKEEERLDKHPDKEMIKKVKAMMAKEKPLKEEADPIEAEMRMHLQQYREGNIDGDDLARAFEEILFGYTEPPMDESFDSLAKKLDKQKGIDKEEAGKIAGSIAAKKMAGAGKGPTAKQKKRMSEADAIPTSAGEMKRGDDGKMYNVIASNAERKMAMRSVIDILRDELSVSQDDAFDYIKTHRDDLFDGTVDAFDRDDVVDDYKNYESVNESDSNLKEHFKRFK